MEVKHIVIVLCYTSIFTICFNFAEVKISYSQNSIGWRICFQSTSKATIIGTIALVMVALVTYVLPVLD